MGCELSFLDTISSQIVAVMLDEGSNLMFVEESYVGQVRFHREKL